MASESTDGITKGGMEWVLNLPTNYTRVFFYAPGAPDGRLHDMGYIYLGIDDYNTGQRIYYKREELYGTPQMIFVQPSPNPFGPGQIHVGFKFNFQGLTWRIYCDDQ